MSDSFADELLTGHCTACESGTGLLDAQQIQAVLPQLEGWEYDDAAKSFVRLFSFRNYYETTAFVNAVAWIAHTEDHHPEIEFGYKTCRIQFSTHSAGGVTRNDTLCAAKVNQLTAAEDGVR